MQAGGRIFSHPCVLFRHMGTIVSIVVFLAGVAFYFLPYLIARSRKKRNVNGIGILNLLLGWTLLGWVGALIWAVLEDPPVQQLPASTPDA